MNTQEKKPLTPEEQAEKERIKKRTEQHFTYHKVFMNRNGLNTSAIKGKIPFRYPGLREAVILLWKTDLDAPGGVYIEMINKKYDPLHPDRRLYYLPFSPLDSKYNDFYEYKNGYAIPESKLIAITPITSELTTLEQMDLFDANEKLALAQEPVKELVATIDLPPVDNEAKASKLSTKNLKTPAATVSKPTAKPETGKTVEDFFEQFPIDFSKQSSLSEVTDYDITAILSRSPELTEKDGLKAVIKYLIEKDKRQKNN